MPKIPVHVFLRTMAGPVCLLFLRGVCPGMGVAVFARVQRLWILRPREMTGSCSKVLLILGKVMFAKGAELRDPSLTSLLLGSTWEAGLPSLLGGGHSQPLPWIWNKRLQCRLLGLTPLPAAGFIDPGRGLGIRTPYVSPGDGKSGPTQSLAACKLLRILDS